MPDAALPPAVFFMGPTASGKTGLAVALAQRFPFEIVSVDSALVYRGMDIGTAKPDAATLAQAPHHLIDIREPTEAYSAAAFRADALEGMQAIRARGRVPLLVGGTMLYFRALLLGLDDLPSADAALRESIERQAAEQGWPALHAVLKACDPQTAARLPPTDAQRIQRALEIFRLSGKPMSSLIDQPRRPLDFDVMQLALIPADRAALHRRIAERFDAMLEAGLLEEVAELRQRYALNPEMPSMRCVGYRQAWEYLDGAIDRTRLREKAVAATRQLAKRQLTWLRSWPGLVEFDSESARALDQIGERVERHLR